MKKKMMMMTTIANDDVLSAVRGSL